MTNYASTAPPVPISPRSGRPVNEFATWLLEHPNEWGRKEYAANSVHTMATRYRAKGFDCTTRTLDGKCYLYARYIPVEQGKEEK